MKKLHVNTKSTSFEELRKLAKTCKFSIFEGNKHCKVKTTSGDFVTIIPRHAVIKRETAKGIVIAMNKFGAEITFN